VTTVYGTWKTTSGLTLPTETTEKVKGEVKAASTVTSYQINAGFSEDLFKQPSDKAEKN